MAIRIINKIGVSDTEAELLLTVQSDGTIVYCSDTLNTFTYIGGSWLNFDNQKVYENSPIPASVIVEDSSNRLVSDSEKTTWNAKQDALVSATNIKTINGSSILGSGDLTVSGSGLAQFQVRQLTRR